MKFLLVMLAYMMHNTYRCKQCFAKVVCANKQSRIYTKRTKIGTKNTCGVEAWKRYVFVPIHMRRKKGFA